jgi:predicted transcriptional regulator
MQSRRPDAAYALLAPVLAERTRFPILGRIGDFGTGPLPAVNPFLDRIAAGRTEGGWVVIGDALHQQLDRDMARALTRCREFVLLADVWYGADILGERVPGPALLASFEPAPVHFWAKRSRGAPEHVAQAERLLGFLEPMFPEWEMDAVKGVGWGLKTLGKYYPALLTDWLVQQVADRQRRHRALMLRKALTYLPDEQRARVTGDAPRVR